MSVEVQSWVMDGQVVHGRVAGPAQGRGVLLLHGAAFSSATWEQTGTYARLAAAGLRVVGLDLPGSRAAPEGRADPDVFLARLLPLLDLDRPVVVAPSMSGRFAFPLVLDHPERVGGFVPVAPASIAAFSSRLGAVAVPTLVLWGGDDTVFPVEQGETLAAAVPGARLVVFDGAPHPCYLQATEAFHAELLHFIAGLE